MAVISVLVIESDANARNEIVRAVKAAGTHIGSIDTATDLMARMKTPDPPPDVVLLPVTDPEQGGSHVSRILSRWPTATVFVTAAVKDPDWILRLIRAGASEYLMKPLLVADLAQAFTKVARKLGQRDGSRSEGRTITVYNPSGGMGTTTVAVNLAATLAGQGENVALVDLNLFCGNVTSFLDMSPRYSLESITTNMGRFDGNFLMTVMERHSTGIHVLSSPPSLEDSAEITAGQVQDLVSVLRGMFSYTIIDCGGPVLDCNRAVFTASDEILYTTVLDLPALKTAKRYLPVLHQLGQSNTQVRLVVNRHVPRGEIKVSDAERILNINAFSTIPNSYAEVKGSINKGVPIVACYPKSPVAKAITELGYLLK